MMNSLKSDDPLDKCKENVPSSFHSSAGDYDFPSYLSKTEEWVNFRETVPQFHKFINGSFAIIELNRFVPFIDGKYIQFHPLNMPYVKIGKVNIMGLVLKVNDGPKVNEYLVDDGTGTITVCCNRVINNKHAQVECSNNFSGPLSGSQYSNCLKASKEIKNRLHSKQIERFDYIYAKGYCNLDLTYQKLVEEITYADLCRAKLNFFATEIQCIEEKEYNKEFALWMHTIIKRRYSKDAISLNFKGTL